MPAVNYAHRFPYIGFEPRFPGLLVTIRNHESAVEVIAHIDTGAERSLFDGGLAQALNLDLLEGQECQFSFIAAPGLRAREHAVMVEHEVLGVFHLRLALSTGDIARNILGRDFLNLVQIGFRERELEFYITGEP